MSLVLFLSNNNHRKKLLIIMKIKSQSFNPNKKNKLYSSNLWASKRKRWKNQKPCSLLEGWRRSRIHSKKLSKRKYRKLFGITWETDNKQDTGLKSSSKTFSSRKTICNNLTRSLEKFLMTKTPPPREATKPTSFS